MRVVCWFDALCFFIAVVSVCLDVRVCVRVCFVVCIAVMLCVVVCCVVVLCVCVAEFVCVPVCCCLCCGGVVYVSVLLCCCVGVVVLVCVGCICLSVVFGFVALIVWFECCAVWCVLIEMMMFCIGLGCLLSLCVVLC